MALSDFVMVNPIDQPAGATVGMPHIKSHHIMSGARNNSCYMFLLLVSGFDSPFNLFQKNRVWYIESTATIPRSSCVALHSFPMSSKHLDEGLGFSQGHQSWCAHDDNIHPSFPYVKQIKTNVWWHFANWLFNLVAGFNPSEKYEFVNFVRIISNILWKIIQPCLKPPTS